MSADEPDSTDEDDRWAKDADGRTVFYPRGLSRDGYLIVDPDREQAVRAADQRYAWLTGVGTVLSFVFLFACVCAFLYLRKDHFAFALGPAAIVALRLSARLTQWMLFAELLRPLPRVAPPDLAAIRRLRRQQLAILVVILAVGIASWSFVHLDDLRAAGLLPPYR
jgi:hypothetical protein